MLLKEHTKYNNEFSVIDTEEKAYFLGQAFGDGYNNCCTPYKFSMASIDTDYILYDKLSELFPFLKFKKYSSHENVVYLECYEKQFVLDIAKHGLISNKTKNDSNGLFHFPDLEPQLIPHFIRGYFDADGSCWYPTRNRSRNNTHIEFGCSTPNFLKVIYKILEENNIHFTWKERMKRASNGKQYKSYCIYACNKEMCKKFADFIYKNATVYLSRKYELCYKKSILRPTAYECFVACPNCGSSNIWRSGIRKPSVRLICKSCNKRFSKPLAEEKFLRKTGTLKWESEVKANLKN